MTDCKNPNGTRAVTRDDGFIPHTIENLSETRENKTKILKNKNTNFHRVEREKSGRFEFWKLKNKKNIAYHSIFFFFYYQA